MTRPHPFDVAFGEDAKTLFASITAGAAPAPDLTGFVRRQDVSDLLDRYLPGETVDPTVRGGLAQLSYAAFRFWHSGQRTQDVDPDILQSGLPAVPMPREAAYLRFPSHVFWGQIEPDAPHEPLDGIWIAPTDDRLIVAAILGIHPDRMGFSQIIAEADKAGWEEARLNLRTPPFAPAMEGGATMGLKSVVSEAELIFLTQLALTSGGR